MSETILENIIILTLLATTTASIFLYFIEKNKNSKKEQEIATLDSEFNNKMDKINNELKIPLYSAETFRSMLKSEIFGPVHPLYIKYFDDVYISNANIIEKTKTIKLNYK